jgi:hypothetical protein
MAPATLPIGAVWREPGPGWSLNVEKSVQVELRYSDAGCPLFLPGDKARLVIEVHEGGPGPTGAAQMRHVGLGGNKQGLIDLATALLALAESAESHHHLHLDDLYEGVIDSPQGFWLTVVKLNDVEG